MTIIEVTIALSLLLIVTLSSFSAMTLSARGGRYSQGELYATELINRTIEDLRSSAISGGFARLGTNQAPESKFLAAQNYTMNPSAVNNYNLNFSVTCNFMGAGTIAAAAATTLTANFPANFPAWTANQWTGHLAMITSGNGRGQIAYIVSNTATTLTICQNLDGTGGGGWYVTPAAGDSYLIDNGITVQIVSSWTQRATQRSLTRTALIPSPN